MMALARLGKLRWGVLFLCLILGTWLGIFLQRFAASAPLFSNVVDVAVDIRQVDLIMLRFGFHFALKMNLGTLLGALAGLYVSK